MTAVDTPFFWAPGDGFLVYGHEPFGWQRETSAAVLAGDWPQSIAMPTASGKTALIGSMTLWGISISRNPGHQRTPIGLFENGPTTF